MTNKLRKPEWIKVQLPIQEAYFNIKNLIKTHKLNTVCEEAACPNRGECWSQGTATFMILGNICTRSCGFCNVITGKPTELDLDEPIRVARAAQTLNLKHLVITSVNRDELADGGASIWANTIIEVRRLNPNAQIEVLIPDLKGNREALITIFETYPDILNHNIETVPRLYSQVRPQANFEQSLQVLQLAKAHNLTTKSGIMLGLGEDTSEVIQVLEELRRNQVDLLTIGQYLQPTPNHLPVIRYIHPDEFNNYRDIGLKLGFKNVFSGPLVRSSYHAFDQANVLPV